MIPSTVYDNLDRTVRALDRSAGRWGPPIGTATRALSVPLRAVRHLWRNRRYITALKLLNIAIVNLELLLKRDRLIGMPYTIKIEPTNICNGTCRLCPTGSGLKGRAKGKMPFEKFRRVIDQIKHHTYALDLSNWGEPLIVPDIYRMIRYAHQAGIWTYVSSNLNAFPMHGEPARELVASGLDMLNCSLHAATQATYETYQPGKNLDLAIRNVKAIVQAKQRLGFRTPVVQLSFVVTKHNEHEIDAFRSLADELDCDPAFMPASLNLRFAGRGEHLENLGWSSEQKAEYKLKKKQHWLPKDQKWIAPWYRGNGPDIFHGKSSRRNKRYRCTAPWRTAVINWDGAVSVCCGVFDPQWEMGNVFDQPLRSIWNNHAYRAARQSFRRTGNGRPGQPCSSCPGILI